MRVHALAALAAVLAGITLVRAQSPAPQFADAHATDPAALGWMMGAPPPAGKIVRFSEGTHYKFPQTRWSFSHMRELVPTVAVPRGQGPASALPRAERRELDAVTFTPIGGGAPMTWGAAFDANYTDGIVVLHRGRTPAAPPVPVLDVRSRTLRLRIPARWLHDHPLTRADLTQEAAYLADAGYTLTVARQGAV